MSPRTCVASAACSGEGRAKTGFRQGRRRRAQPVALASRGDVRSGDARRGDPREGLRVRRAGLDHRRLDDVPSRERRPDISTTCSSFVSTAARRSRISRRRCKSPAPPPAWAVFVGGPNAPDPEQRSPTRRSISTPGNYVVLCLVDIPDHVPHFAKGMIRPLKVAAATGPAASEPTPTRRSTLSRLRVHDVTAR